MSRRALWSLLAALLLAAAGFLLGLTRPAGGVTGTVDQGQLDRLDGNAWRACRNAAPNSTSRAACVSPTPTVPPTTPAPTTSPAPTTTVPPTTTTPAPSPSPTTTAPAPSPWPDASNTGPVGTLTPAPCPAPLSAAGQVLEGVDLTGCVIDVYGTGVIIRNVRDLGVNNPAMWAVVVHTGASALIQNTTIAGADQGANSVQYAVYVQDGSVEIDHANLSNCADCVQGEAVYLHDSYIHDLANPPGAHVDGYQCNAQCGGTVRHNTIANQWPQTSAVAAFQDFGVPTGLTVDDNLLAGGGYSVYAGGGTRGTPTNIQVTGNHFSPMFYPAYGYWGPVAYYDPSGAGNACTGNVDDLTGAPVSC